MDRRQFIKKSAKLTGISLGAGALGTAGGIALIQPRRAQLPFRAADRDARPEKAEQRKRVVIIGGGLAGMVSAIELAERNFEVTLLERATELGGKIGGWDVDALGETFPVEHGFHGFFNQYYNLNDLLTRAGAMGYLKQADDYPVLFKDRAPERFGAGTKIFPLNLLSVIGQSDNLNLMDFRPQGTGLLELMRYQGEATYAAFDGRNFMDFCREEGINAPLVETVLAPFGKTTLNRLEKLSAAEALRFFHFYFMGNPEGLGFRIAGRDIQSAVVGRLYRMLLNLGVNVRFGAAVQKIVHSDGRPRAVEVSAGNMPAPPLTVDVAQVAEGVWNRFERSDGSPVFVRRNAAGYQALDGRCSHMGCPVGVAGDGGFICPCHAGRYDDSGARVAGPPPRSLDTLSVRRVDDVLHIEQGQNSSVELVEGDYFVLAAEVRGAKALIRRSELPDAEFNRRITSLGEADPYIVWRLWFDKPVRPERSAFYTVSRYRYTDSLAIYSNFQDPYREWAEKTGGSVVEVHAYAMTAEQDKSPESIRAAMLGELSHLLPELRDARILFDAYMRQSNFTRWAPGDYAMRPGTDTPWANLLLAGDYVRIDAPVSLMEAATMSARLAVNSVLWREGLREIAIPTVAPEGPLA